MALLKNELRDRANISKLIEAIARQKLKIAPNHDWSIERYISCHQPFQLSYQDAADKLFQFTIRHARIVPRNI